MLAMTQYDLDAVLPKVILEDVEEAARPKRYFRQLVRINTDLLGRPGRSLIIPRRGTMTAGRVSEGASIPDAYGKDIYATGVAGSAYQVAANVAPFKTSTKFQITQEAIDGSEFDVIRDHIEEAGQALAQQEDLEIARELFGRASLSEKVAKSGANKVYQASSYPILSVTKVADSAAATTTKTVNAVDYKDGKIKVTESCSGTKVILRYKYSTRTDTLFVDASTAGKLAYNDLRDMRNKVTVAKWQPDVVVIHPDEEADLLSDSRFIDAAQYGDRAPILNGEIGKIGGLRVLVSTNLIPGSIISLDTSRAAYLVIKRNLDLKRKDRPETDSTELYFYQEYAPAVINEDCMSFTTDCASDANKSL